MKLEVGKPYVNGFGEKVKIVGTTGGGWHPYKGANGLTYTENGEWIKGQESPRDLIAEWADEPAPDYADDDVPQSLGFDDLAARVSALEAQMADARTVTVAEAAKVLRDMLDYTIPDIPLSEQDARRLWDKVNGETGPAAVHAFLEVCLSIRALETQGGQSTAPQKGESE